MTVLFNSEISRWGTHAKFALWSFIVVSFWTIGYIIGTEGVNPVTFAIFLMALGISVVTWANINLGIALYLVIIPFVGLLKRLTLWFSVSQFEWYLVLFAPDMILLFLCFHVVYRSIHKGRFPYSKLHLPVLIFFVYCLILAFHPGVPLLQGFAGFKLLSLSVLAYFIVSLGIKSISQIQQIFKITVGLAVLTGIYGIYQFYFGIATFEEAWLYSGRSIHKAGSPVLMPEGVLRPFSTFASHDTFAFYLSISLILSIFFWRGRILLLGPAVSAFITIVLLRTLVRSAWMGAFAGIVMYLVIRKGIGRPKAILVGIIAILVLVLIVVPALSWIYQSSWKDIKFRISHEIPIMMRNYIDFSPYIAKSFSVGTYSDRAIAFNKFMNNKDLRPIFGHGIGSFGMAASKFGKSKVDALHNLFLDLIYQIGWFGFGLFLWVIVRAFQIGVKIINSGVVGSRRIAAIACSGMSVVLVPGALTNNTMLLPLTGVYFWLMVGILSSLSAIGLQTEKQIN